MSMFKIFYDFFPGLPSQDNTGHFGPFQVCKYHGYYSFCGSQQAPYKRQSKQDFEDFLTMKTFQIVLRLYTLQTCDLPFVAKLPLIILSHNTDNELQH